VPPLYLLFVLWLQPSDRLGEPDVAPELGRWFYDDYEGIAKALRGLNATLGRLPGRPSEPPVLTEAEFCRDLDTPRPLAPRYFLEYPHAALLLFHLGYLLQPGMDNLEVPAAVADGWLNNLVGHVPRNDPERRLWRHIRRAIQIYTIGLTVCLLLLMVVIDLGYEAGRELSGPVVLLILPSALYFSLNRFDIVPALLMALSLACLGRRWIVASAVFLGAAAMVKVYPILFAPLVFRFLCAERRTAAVWLGVFMATLVAFLLPPLLLTDWTATWAPYRFQLSRPPEYGWTFYGYVLPAFLAEHNPVGTLFRLGTVLLVTLALCWHRPADMADLLRRGAIVLILLVSLAVFYSPQWVLWFSPLLLPLASRDRRVFVLVVALDLITYLSFPVTYDYWGNTPMVGAMVFSRFALFAGLIGLMGWTTFQERNTGSKSWETH
jgi:hypothetical protein